MFVFNFHPYKSFEGYFLPVKEEGEYQVILSTDQTEFGGQGHVDMQYRYQAQEIEGRGLGFLCYIPSRCGMVIKKCRKRPVRKNK